MPLTLEQIVEETRHWPPEKIGELLGILTEDLRAIDPDIESTWTADIERRIDEIQSGKAEGIDGEEVSARIRKLLGN